MQETEELMENICSDLSSCSRVKVGGPAGNFIRPELSTMNCRRLKDSLHDKSWMDVMMISVSSPHRN